MTRIEKLRARRNEKAGEINTKSKELQSLLAKDDATLDDIKGATTAKIAADAELKAIDDELSTLVAADQAAAAAAAPAAAPVADRTVPAAVKQSLTGDEKIGLAITAVFKAHDKGQRGNEAVLAVMEADGYGSVASEFAAGQKTMLSSSGSTGGFAVPETMNTEIFDMLTPASAFLQGRPTMQPMPNGNFVQSGAASRPSVGFKVEGAASSVSTATLREISMSAKTLTGIVPVSNALIRYTSGRAFSAASKLLAQAVGLKIDEAMLIGNGTSPNPRGIFNIVGIGSRAAAAGIAPTSAVIDSAVRLLLNEIEAYPELQFGLAWVGTQRTKGYLTDLRTPGGENYAYPTMQNANPTFKGYPFLRTAQVVNNGGAGTNESTLALVSFSNVLFGESQGMILSVSDQATYVDGSTVVSAYQNNLSLLKVETELDVAIRYNEAVQKLTAVQWGAAA